MRIPPRLFSVVTTILGYLIQCVVTPVLTICLSLMYYDERVRKEAFDIHLMMSALDKARRERQQSGPPEMRMLRIVLLLILAGPALAAAPAQKALSLPQYIEALQQLRAVVIGVRGHECCLLGAGESSLGMAGRSRGA